MPQFSFNAKDAVMNSLDVSFLSLHSDYDPTGGNEVTDPSYARMPVTFDPSANGQRLLTTGSYVFSLSGPTPVAWVGMWDGSGNFQGMIPNGGDNLRPVVIDDLASNLIKSSGNGFAADDTVVFWGGSAGAPPIDIPEGAIFYVVTTGTDTFQVSVDLHGTPIEFSGTGNAFVQRVYPVVATGTFPISSMVLDATVAG